MLICDNTDLFGRLSLNLLYRLIKKRMCFVVVASRPGHRVESNEASLAKILASNKLRKLECAPSGNLTEQLIGMSLSTAKRYFARKQRVSSSSASASASSEEKFPLFDEDIMAMQQKLSKGDLSTDEFRSINRELAEHYILTLEENVSRCTS